MKTPELNIQDIEELKKTKDFWYTFFKKTVQDSIAQRVSRAIENIFSGVPLPEEDILIIHGYFKNAQVLNALKGAPLPPVIEKIGGIGVFQKLIIEEETTKKIFDIIEKDISKGDNMGRFLINFGFTKLSEIKTYLNLPSGETIRAQYFLGNGNLILETSQNTKYEISKNGSIWITPKGQPFASLSKKFLPKKKKNTLK